MVLNTVLKVAVARELEPRSKPREGIFEKKKFKADRHFNSVQLKRLRNSFTSLIINSYHGPKMIFSNTIVQTIEARIWTKLTVDRVPCSPSSLYICFLCE